MPSQLQLLRRAYSELNSAKKGITNAHTHSTDASMVFGTTGLALQHVAKAQELIEEAAQLANEPTTQKRKASSGARRL